MKVITNSNEWLTEDDLMQYEAEYKVLSSIDHPNIVKYIDMFRDKEGMLCFAMEYAEFGDY